MKKKIFGSLLIILMICFVSLGGFGCEAKNRYVLSAKGRINSTSRMLYSEWSEDEDNKDKTYADYNEEYQEARFEALKGITEITFTDTQTGKTRTFKAQTKYRYDSDWVTEKKKDEDGSVIEPDQTLDVSAFEDFEQEGGNVFEFQLSNPPGTYTCYLCFEYGAKFEMNYTIT